MSDGKTPNATAPAITKPVRPDVEVFKEKLAKAEKEHQDAMSRFNAIKAKIELVQPDKNKNSAERAQKRKQELIAQANEIRQKQGAGKTVRSTKLEKIKRLDEQMRSRIAEQKNARGKVSFKSVEEVDYEIARLENEVSSGMMKLVDEKKALAEISNLRKQRKNFAQFDDSQKQIEDIKAKIKEIKESMEDAEAKALSEQYNKIQAQIDVIKAEQDEAYKNLSTLRDERSKLRAEQDEKYDVIRRLKDEYYGQKKTFAEWERDQRAKYRERQAAERAQYFKDKKMERAQRMLAEASDPAYLEEIRRANSLLHFFDPSHQVETKTPLLADKGLAAQAQRNVDGSGLKGMKLVRKEDREDEYLPAVKKGKKGKKGGAAEGAKVSGKFNCPPSVIEECTFVGVDPPMSAADLPEMMEKVKAKLEYWKADQGEQTKKNIEKAKEEIAKLETEEEGNEGTRAPAPVDGVNGGKSEDADNAVAETTECVKAASLEESKIEEAAAKDFGPS